MTTADREEALRRLERKKLAYRATFLDANGRVAPHAREVLDDLRRLARLTNPLVISPVSGVVDAHATFTRIGRTEVYMRIVHMLELPGFTGEEGNHDGSEQPAEQRPVVRRAARRRAA